MRPKVTATNARKAVSEPGRAAGHQAHIFNPEI